MDNLDQRGQRIRLNVELGSGPKPAVGGKDILRANYCPIPLMLSNLGYAIFFIQLCPPTGIWDGVNTTVIVSVHLVVTMTIFYLWAEHGEHDT